MDARGNEGHGKEVTKNQGKKPRPEKDKNRSVQLQVSRPSPPHDQESPETKKQDDSDEGGSTGSHESVGTLLARKMQELTL